MLLWAVAHDNDITFSTLPSKRCMSHQCETFQGCHKEQPRNLQSSKLEVQLLGRRFQMSTFLIFFQISLRRKETILFAWLEATTGIYEKEARARNFFFFFQWRDAMHRLLIVLWLYVWFIRSECFDVRMFSSYTYLKIILRYKLCSFLCGIFCCFCEFLWLKHNVAT